MRRNRIDHKVDDADLNHPCAINEWMISASAMEAFPRQNQAGVDRQMTYRPAAQRV